MDQVRRIRADAPGHPADAVVVRPRPVSYRQVLERQEGRGPKAVVAEICDGRPSVFEPLDDHPLEPLSQHRFDGALHAGWDFEQVRDGTDHAGQRDAPVLREHRADASPIALARTLELGQGLEARPARRQGHARVGEPRLGLDRPSRFVGFLCIEPPALLLQRAELGGGSVTHDGQLGPLRHEPVGLRPGLGELGREPLGASPQLSLALP